MRIAMLLLIVCWASACRQPAPPPAQPAPAPVEVPPPASRVEWPGALATAIRAAEAGHYDEADRVLLEFGQRHAGTAEGADSDFWRALLRADPANPSPSTRERIAMLDAYLAGGSGSPRYLEALVLRRLLEGVDSTRSALTALRAQAEVRQRSREDEIRKLSEDLDRAMAELERIKKRLAPTKPPGQG
jgi:hypothetical protein